MQPRSTTRQTSRSPVRIRYNTRPTTTSSTRSSSLKDLYRRVPKSTNQSGVRYGSPALRSSVTNRYNSRYSSDVKRNSARPSTNVRSANPGAPRLGSRSSRNTAGTGTASLRPTSLTRTPTLNGTRRTASLGVRPSRSFPRYASSHYGYGGSSHYYPRNRYFSSWLGLGFCYHLGWHSYWHHYTYDPFYRNYYLGYGWHHYHWSYHYCHPLNYATWWYPTSYSYCSPTYIYINDRGDYSPAPSTIVIDYNDDPTDDESVVVAGGDAKEKPSAETLVKRHLTLGDFYFKEGRYSEASESYLRALAYAPEDASLHFVLADSLFAMGDYHYAAFIIKKALRIDRSMAFVEADKRTFYSDPKEFEKHLKTVTAYTKEKPFDAAAQLVLAYNLKFSGQKDRAIAAFKRLLEIDASNQAGKLFLEALLPPKDSKVKPESTPEKGVPSVKSAPEKPKNKKDN